MPTNACLSRIAPARLGRALVLTVVLGLASPALRADEPAKPAAPKQGVLVHDARAQDGYTLIFPMSSPRTYLVDMQGRVVHTWTSKYGPGQETYLLENGHLLRPSKLADKEAIFAGAGGGGRIQEFDTDGKIVWDFKFHDEKRTQHHAITRMPNGNIMMIVWERVSAKEAVDAGVKPENAAGIDMLVDSLVEIQPTGPTDGKIVWEWHLWDHIVQDFDKTKPNFGDVAAHPELIDANFEREAAQVIANMGRAGPAVAKADSTKKAGSKDDAFDRLKGIGYVGAGSTSSKKFQGFFPDWNHVNAVSYNAKLDQLLLSSRQFSEIWIIDHSTTTAEAKGHSGGRYGKGGDLLFRWGNPRAYRAGNHADQRLFNQHDAQWIADGLAGAGHILLFNNGSGRPDGTNYSSVDEIVPPIAPDGRYQYTPGTAFGPDQATWSFFLPNKEDFFTPFMCGAQRLPNGNTLLSTGFAGSVWEVTPSKEIVWKYVVPRDMRPGTEIGIIPGVNNAAPSGFGTGSKRSIQVLPPGSSVWMGLTPEQQKALEAFDRKATAAIDALLTAAQRKQLKGIMAGLFFEEPGPGELLSARAVETLKLTAEQRAKLAELQKEGMAKLQATLAGVQKTWLGTILATRKAFLGGPDGPPGNAIFRAYRYPKDYPGLAKLDLKPGPTIDEFAKVPPKK